MLLQACLNGDRAKTDHAAVPVTPDELGRAAAACVAAGAAELHIHPRDGDARESLDPAVVDAAVARTRAACGCPVGVTSDAFIEPDVERRLALLRRWREPDYASVNLCDSGAVEVMRTLTDAGIGIEAGVWTVEDAVRLAASGFGNRVVHVLVEPVDVDAAEGLAAVDAIHAALDRLELRAPRLQHGDGDATWALLDDARRRGLASRIGLEDTLTGRDGRAAADNAALVCAALPPQ